MSKNVYLYRSLKLNISYLDLPFMFFIYLVQELTEWNARYKEKFGFVFLICASGRSTEEILSELKVQLLLIFVMENFSLLLVS